MMLYVRVTSGVLVVRKVDARGRNTNVKGLILEDTSMSLSPTLSRIEKVEQHIRKKTYKPIVLKFLLESEVKQFIVLSNYFINFLNLLIVFDNTLLVSLPKKNNN